MKTVLTTALIVLLFAGCASRFGEDWSRGDTARQVTWTALHLVDWAQTDEIMHNENYREMNPLINESNIHWIMVGSIATELTINMCLAPEWRERWQLLGIISKTALIGNNYSIGIRF